jgi:hypothetical protein
MDKFITKRKKEGGDDKADSPKKAKRFVVQYSV